MYRNYWWLLLVVVVWYGCTPERLNPGGLCGDGRVNAGEECDHGANNSDSGACTMACRDAYCGDGLIGLAELCDEGPLNSDTLANHCRTNCGTPHCGDGVRDEGEACDDANNIDADGCTNDCRDHFCGNGVVDGSEECDDGNRETESCLYGQTTCVVCNGTCQAVAGQVSYCGDTVIDLASGESCDDGNSITESCEDGVTECVICNDSCQEVAGFASYCGDGVVDSSRDELCDDGNTVTEVCAYGERSCTVCAADCRDIAGATSYCGDTLVDSSKGEACDDGNAETEVCDYGATDCVVCNDVCQEIVGSASYCGDGVIDELNGESCDDGNDDDGDWCLNACATAGCGDGVVHVGMEECDDGNLANVDGCSATCVAEYLSCKAVLDAGVTTGNGTYWIDPDGGGGRDSFEVYCDMDAGGWTLVAAAIGGQRPAESWTARGGVHLGQAAEASATFRFSDVTITALAEVSNIMRYTKSHGSPTYAPVPESFDSHATQPGGVHDEMVIGPPIACLNESLTESCHAIYSDENTGPWGTYIAHGWGNPRDAVLIGHRACGDKFGLTGYPCDIDNWSNPEVWLKLWLK